MLRKFTLNQKNPRNRKAKNPRWQVYGFYDERNKTKGIDSSRLMENSIKWGMDIKINYARINREENQEKPNMVYEYLLYPTPMEEKQQVIRCKKKLTEFLKKNPETSDVREELVKNCFPYNTVPSMKE